MIPKTAGEFRTFILQIANDYEKWLIENKREASQKSFGDFGGFTSSDVMERIHVYRAVQNIRRCALAEAV